MLPEAKGENLLYVAGLYKTYVFSWPSGKQVGELDIGAWYACSDKNGNVWVLAKGPVYEYAHGGKSPIATITPPYNSLAFFCSVDATTGNLALFLFCESCKYLDYVAVYSNPQSQPTLYNADISVSGLGYDDKGNLFASGRTESGDQVVELPEKWYTVRSGLCKSEWPSLSKLGSFSVVRALLIA